MHRIAVVVALAFAAITTAYSPVGADVTGGARHVQTLFLNFQEIYVDENGQHVGSMFADFSVLLQRGASASGPVNAVSASGFIAIDRRDTGHEFESYPWQEVDPAAFVLDPVANSATFDAALYLDPQTSSGAAPFKLTASKPTHTSVAHPDSHNPGINGYVGADGEAGASWFAQVGLHRYGYELRGTVAGRPVVGSPTGCGGACTWAHANTFSGAVADPVIKL